MCGECLTAAIDDEEMKPLCFECAESRDVKACNHCLTYAVTNEV